MKYSLIAALCTLTFVSCGPNTSQTSETRVSKADSTHTRAVDISRLKQVSFSVPPDYYVANTSKQSDTTACWVFTNASQRDLVFGVAEKMKDKIDTIDFANEIMVAVTLVPSQLHQHISLSSAVQADDEIDLNFVIKSDSTSNRPATDAAVWIGALPKTMGVRKVKFYNGDKLLETERVKE